MPECTVCGRLKKPWGRSAPFGASLCDHECEGYMKDPKPGTLWPDEQPNAAGLVAESQTVCHGATVPVPAAPESETPETDALVDAFGDSQRMIDHARSLERRLRAAERDAARLDYLEKYAVIAKPGQQVRAAIDKAMKSGSKSQTETK